MRDLFWAAVVLLLAILGGYNIIALRNTNRELKAQAREADGRIERLKEEVAWKTKEVGMKDEEVQLARRESLSKMAMLEERLKIANAEFKERQDSLRQDYERRLDELRAAHKDEIARLSEHNDYDRDRPAIRPIVTRSKEVEVKRESKCPCCHGIGVVEVEKICDACGGKGFTVEVVDRLRRHGYLGAGYYESPYKASRIEHCCLVCKKKNSLDRRGSGRVKVTETCPRCLGRGVL
jgi:flagellar biosynthesis GTPase FlhF